MEMIFLLLLLLTGLAWPLPRRYYLIQQGQTWSNAQAYCRSAHTDLATAESATQLLELQAEAQAQSFSGDAWMGLYRSGGWSWSLGNGPLGSYTRWQVNQPDNGGGNEDCVMFDWLGWADVTCAYILTFTCFDATLKQLIYYPNALSWSDAQSFCRFYHTDLASVEDDATYNFIMSHQQTASWFGLHNSAPEWLWSDRTPLTDVPWPSGQPDDLLGKENCGIVGNGGLGDAVCGDVKPFFCYSVITGRRLIMSLTIQSSQDPNQPVLKEALLQKMKEDLGERVATMNLTLKWRQQPGGVTFHR